MKVVDPDQEANLDGESLVPSDRMDQGRRTLSSSGSGRAEVSIFGPSAEGFRVIALLIWTLRISIATLRWNEVKGRIPPCKMLIPGSIPVAVFFCYGASVSFSLGARTNHSEGTN